MRKSQSILEYAILIGVIAAGILVMQSFVKRGFQGGLKDSADKMGEQFSASGTQIYRKREMQSDQFITEESGTEAGGIIQDLSGEEVKGAVSKGAYSISSREGGRAQATTKQTSDQAVSEKYGYEEHAVGSDEAGFQMEHGF
ncbi:MAG: hypothetical protein JSW17_03465 [Candidatus Omnitrophota bacterium]|nr:MAG: hypothetical protein JSW17_03465 [Candidatus Omnitrophota bacterium]